MYHPLFPIEYICWINDMLKNTLAWQRLWNANYSKNYLKGTVEVFISLN